MLSLATVALFAIFVVIIFFSAVRILREYERGVVFTLGRYTGTKGPGFFLLVPFIQQMVRVDLRVIVDEVPPQDVISRDNVSVKVNAVIYFRVVDAERRLELHAHPVDRRLLDVVRDFGERWLSGSARVGNTELVVVVQQRDRVAVAAQRSFFKRFANERAAAGAR